jgi:hypothetical protein
VTSRPSPPLPPGRDDVLVELLAPNEALDEGLVEQLVRLINGAYALGEPDFGTWVRRESSRVRSPPRSAITD